MNELKKPCKASKTTGMNGGSLLKVLSSPATSNTIKFTVLGRAATAGSKRVFQVASGFNVTHDNKRAVGWMNDCKMLASAAMNSRPVMEGPIQFSAVFYFARPKGHYGTGRNAGKLKPSAPNFITKKPDLTKLIRAVEDALTKVVWRDDSQIVAYGDIRKVWSPDGTEWVDVEVSELEG